VNSLAPAELPPIGAIPGSVLGGNAAGPGSDELGGAPKTPPEPSGGGIGGGPPAGDTGAAADALPNEPPNGGGAPNDPLSGGGAPNDPPIEGGGPAGDPNEALSGGEPGGPPEPIVGGDGGAADGIADLAGSANVAGPGGPMIDGSPASPGGVTGGIPPGDDVLGPAGTPNDGGAGGAVNCGALDPGALGLENP
jgi:hypothetical protein